MKAKKVAPKALIESQSSSRKRTDEANEYMKNVAAIDRQLDEMKRKRKQKLEEGIKRTSIDVDALFDVDDEVSFRISYTLMKILLSASTQENYKNIFITGFY